MIYCEITKPYYEIPLCECTTGKTLELVCFENHCKFFVSFVVLNSTLRYGIPSGGQFYCVLCEGAFVITFKSVFCGRSEIIIRNGEHSCRITEKGTSTRSTQNAPIQEGSLTLYRDGSLSVNDFRWKMSPYGNPVVYTRGMVAVDAEGNLIIRDGYRYPKLEEYRFIMATSDGRQCITSDREILSRHGITAPNGERLIDVGGNWFCDVILTQHGNVYFNVQGMEWIKLGNNATAIAVGADYVIAFADKAGRIHMFQYDSDDVIRKKKELYFPGKHITDLDVSGKLLAFLCSDCRYDAVNWESGIRPSSVIPNWNLITERTK